MKRRKVLVFSGSSEKSNPKFVKASGKLGELLGKDGNIDLVYGAGHTGLMVCEKNQYSNFLKQGSMAKAFVKHKNEKSELIGIMPQFMIERKWNYKGCTKLIVTKNMHERKETFLDQKIELIVALPGGIGTLEELLEMMAWKQLGILNSKICLLNIDGFFDPFFQLFENMVKSNFLGGSYRKLYKVFTKVEEVVKYVDVENDWSPEKDGRHIKENDQ